MSSGRAITSTERTKEFAATRLQNQFSDAIAGKNRGLIIRATLKAMRRIRMQPVPPRHLANCHRIPPRRFNQDVARLFRDHGVEAAHGARESDRLLAICYYEVFGRQLALDSIECLQHLAIPRPPHHNLSAFEQIQIEHVRRLAHFPKRVVGSVDGIVDWSLIQQAKASRNLFRRSLDAYISNNARSEPRATLFVLNFNRKWKPDVPAVGRNRQQRLDRFHVQVVDRRTLPRHAIVIHRVRTVGRDVHLEGGLITFAADRLDCNPGQGQIIGELVVIDVEVNEIAQPLRRNFHY